MQACCSRWYLTWNWRVVYPGRAPTCKGWVFSSRYLLVALKEIIQLLYVYRFKSGIFWGSDKALATPRLASLMGLSSHFPTSISNLFTWGSPGPGVVYDTPNYKKWKFCRSLLQAFGPRPSAFLIVPTGREPEQANFADTQDREISDVCWMFWQSFLSFVLIDRCILTFKRAKAFNWFLPFACRVKINLSNYE